MPNHVQNIVRLQGDEKRVQEILEAVKSDQYGLGSVDFEKIIPMPSPLHIECGSKTDRGLNAYRDFLKSEAESEREYLDQKPTITPEEWELGKQAYENIREYGAPTWYEWSVAHWGTKWNAYGMSENAGEGQSNELRFQTAWSAPRPILEKLARMYPRITFEHEWADEDIGVNCGRHIYQGGERVEEYYPEGDVQSTEFALSVWDYDASDLSLTLNAAGTKYINMEMEEYELIELFGNIFNLMGIAAQTLRRAGLDDQAKEMLDRVRESGSYYQALGVIGEYVNITSADDMGEDESEEMEMIL